MNFVLDVGNTNTVLGVFKEDVLKYHWRIKTDRHKTEDEYGMLIQSLFAYEGLSFSDIKGVTISSVVPPIMHSLERVAEKYFHRKPIVIGTEEVEEGLDMAYPNPAEIGADRIVNAVGAIHDYKTPAIIIDFGTATTYCYIDGENRYAGGAIAPGINISMEALYAKAAKLPKIEIKQPGEVVGQSTVEAMQSGVFYGYVGQVDEVVRRMKEANGEAPSVIATGGLADLIANESRTVEHVDPFLTLKGLNVIYQRNKDKDIFQGGTT
ncbi:pantothenate kinase [Salimicrobium jeotgali]|uniref:Type III pantothenate kinase n=2 Tax=Salimicrobium TaxID=351195 RepID=K2H548_9BACI|nr:MULTISPECIES: type III pantothenate kinase [Salimicrobium]AKG05634.1 pantothenate kinase [Salimicrobium jeotgali]EKE31000.1 pantothenate kinase [Salimicrobium jeotgali]MBM7697489.1 type III pantothenate kinase [Salimicrobium jeotgali]SIS96762.1 pantothenate kinase [Salimicrobium salexigens]